MAGTSFSFSGVQVHFLHQISETRHLHQETEILYIMEGTLHVRQDAQEFTLGKDDLILINSNHYHEASGGGLALLQVLIPYEMLSRIRPERVPVFACNTAAENRGSCQELRALLRHLMFACAESKKKSAAMAYSCVYSLLDALVENFEAEEKHNTAGREQRDEDRLQTIISYVNQNYTEQINLGSLAEQMYTSTSSLSRLFKKNMGCYFGDYVNQVRLNQAVQELANTGKTVTKIAADCGFTSLAAFNKQFKNLYGASPTDYRKKRREEAREAQPNGENLAEELKKLGITDDRQKAAWETQTISAEISSCEGEKIKRCWNGILNGGSAYDMTSANTQKQIAFLHESLKFRYVRIWSLFSKRMMLRSERGGSNYNFNVLDNVLDFMTEHHMIPYINLGSRPNCAVMAEGKMVYYEEEYLTFRNAGEWEELLHAFVHHIARRYGREELARWIFDFTVDIRYPFPSLCGSEEETWRFYRRLHGFFQSSLPETAFGGIGGSMSANPQMIRRWLTFCTENDCLPDFVSLMIFPYRETGIDLQERITTENSEAGQLHACRRLMEEYDLADCRLYVAEWNSSLSTRNWLNDSCFRANAYLHLLNQTWGEADAIGIWMASDWCSNYYDTSQVANGGNGIMTRDDIRKPIYHALAFLNRMHPQLVARGKNYIVTANGKGSYYVLCYNYKWYSYRYFQTEENELDLNDLPALFTDSSSVRIDVTLRGLNANRSYAIKRRTVNRKFGSLLGEWSRFEFDSDLDGRDIEYLREVCVPELSKHRQRAQGGVLRFGATLEAHEITLFHIYEEMP